MTYSTSTAQKINQVFKYLLLGFGLLLLVGGARAQSKSAPAPASAPTPTTLKPAAAQPEPLTLTKDELATRDSILSQAQPLQTEIQKLINEFLSTEDEARLPVIWLKSKRLQDKLQPLNTQFTQWLEAVRKAHNCSSCALDNDRLVPPSPATPGKP